MPGTQSDFATPLGSVTSGRLQFARGASRVTILGDGDSDDLIRARFEGTVPMVLADGGNVTIEYPLVSPSEWLRARRAATVMLNAAIPWELVFSRGVSRLRADLTCLTLRFLEIVRGATDLQVVLPEPHGVVRLDVSGGASNVALLHPPGAAVVVAVAGGVNKLEFGGQLYGSIGRETRLASAGAGERPDRYEIEIGGGASQLTIASESGGPEPGR